MFTIKNKLKMKLLIPGELPKFEKDQEAEYVSLCLTLKKELKKTERNKILEPNSEILTYLIDLVLAMLPVFFWVVPWLTKI